MPRDRRHWSGIVRELEALMEKRMYGLFEKQNGKWVRVYPGMAYPKQTAVRIFQNKLLGHCLYGEPERCLKVLPKK